MAFSPEQIKSYQDGDFSCPYCGATSRLATNPPIIERGKHTVKIDCYGCGQSYDEVYTLARLEPIAC